MGRFISNRIGQYGVDVSHVVWAGEDERLGVYFHEKAQPPRASEIVYDRQKLRHEPHVSQAMTCPPACF